MKLKKIIQSYFYNKSLMKFSNTHHNTIKKLEVKSFNELLVNSHTHIQKKSDSKIFDEIYLCENCKYLSKNTLRITMSFLIINSTLLFMEILNPIYLYSFHSFILTGTTTAAWMGIRLFNSFFNRLVYKIEYNNENQIILYCTDFLYASKEILINKQEIINIENSNLENYISFQINSQVKKYYINLIKNKYFQKNKNILDSIFKVR